MQTLLQRIHVGIGAGTALWFGGTGCYDSVMRSSDLVDANDVVVDASRLDATSDALIALDAVSDAVAAVDAGHDAGSMTDGGTYDVKQLGCSGPVYDDGYFGQCCVRVLCYTPDNGSLCIASDASYSVLISTLPGYPPESGDCSCSPMETLPAVAGPFARNPNHADAPPGTCCYLVGMIACTGRPLLVDHELLVAPIVMRGDWLVG